MAELKEITDAKIERYLDLTTRAIKKCQTVAPKPSWNHRMAADFMRMAESYHSDAVDFHANGDHVNSFACVNYAHGWLDAGARMGFWDVGQDDVLFTLLE
jgi:hypothetical protein